MSKHVLLANMLLITLTTFGQNVGSKSYERMLDKLLDHTVPEVSVDSIVTSSPILLDARETNEYAVSGIENAKWVGYNDFSLERMKDISKNEEIVVYCSVGYRSEKIAEKLRSAGYSNVSNLYGGIFEWMNQGHSVVDSTGNKTERVHAFNRIWGVWLKKGKKVY